MLKALPRIPKKQAVPVAHHHAKCRVHPQEMPKEEHELVHYHLWEMVERVANLFRIYPTERRASHWFCVMGQWEEGVLNLSFGRCVEDAS